MTEIPSGKSAVQYEEVCMLIRSYAERLRVGGMSYADLMRNVDRLTALGQEARKLWNDK